MTHITNQIFKYSLSTVGIRDIELIKEIFALGGADDSITRAMINRWKTIVNNEKKQPMPLDMLLCWQKGLLIMSESRRLITHIVRNNNE